MEVGFVSTCTPLRLCTRSPISGIAGAIVSKGGQIIQQQSNEIIKKMGGELPDLSALKNLNSINYVIGGLGDGQVVSTSAGTLPADYVFHAVGPTYSNNPRAESSLHLAVTNSLKKANILDCKSIAMPAISTGIFGYPKVRGFKSIRISSFKPQFVANKYFFVSNRQIRYYKNILCYFNRLIWVRFNFGGSSEDPH